ncbi:MAG: portal protein, partial [bacterium]
MTVRQMAQRFGTDALSEAQRKALETNPDQAFDVIHAVMPRDEMEYGRNDFRGMPWSSCYVNCEGREILDEGGYRAFPYAVGRYVTAPREVYGRSPAMTVLPDIKMLNEMSKTVIRAAHK